MGTQGRTITESSISNVPVLLIGNGPATLSKEMGNAIDMFDGVVVRFNNYTIKGYEKWIGTRTDCWITVANYRPSTDEHKYRYYLSQRVDKKTIDSAQNINATLINNDIWKLMPDYPLSTGAIITEFFLKNNCKIYLWGFDFLSQQRPHHYNNDNCVRGPWHDEFKEWLYFHNKHENGDIHWFKLEDTESSPILRQPVPCGKDDDVSWYRTAAHNAWYEWFGSLSKGKSILDVGAGMCEGMRILDKYSPDVRGIEVDERLLKLDLRLSLKTLDEIPDNSVDVITCVDVIEHVVEDVKLMDDMKRVAKEMIFVTTPCYARSRCGNIAHCREYTIPQFMNFFKPSEIWSASPDGKVHLTKVLSRKGNVIRNHSGEGPDNKNKAIGTYYNNHVPIATKFNKTVDGEEWAHIAACFLKNNGL